VQRRRPRASWIQQLSLHKRQMHWFVFSPLDVSISGEYLADGHTT
jgi:hypothetical protein